VSVKNRTNDPEGLRSKIANVAYDAFSKRGYNATAMQDLRDDANVSGGAFSHHFPSKKELGLFVVRNRVAAAVQSGWIEPVSHAPTAYEGIKTVFEGIIRELDDQGFISGCPLNNMAMELAGLDDEMRSELDGIFNAWEFAIAEKFKADIEKGLATQLHPAHMATLVIASYSGAMSMAKTRQSVVSLRNCWDQLHAILRTHYAAPIEHL
jgi:TetR/AcrR family transcriptional regulator, lmrAB and yxaGH operons repressor